MRKREFRQSFISLCLLIALLAQGTLVLAGTTGTISGTATDSVSHRPLAGVKVTAASPSQVATAVTRCFRALYVSRSLARHVYRFR